MAEYKCEYCGNLYSYHPNVCPTCGARQFKKINEPVEELPDYIHKTALLEVGGNQWAGPNIPSTSPYYSVYETLSVQQETPMMNMWFIVGAVAFIIGIIVVNVLNFIGY